MLSTAPNLLLCSFITLSLLSRVTVAKRDLKSACSTCKQITENFEKGFDRTAKQNFGGGNTAWEERKLSKYETSEIRLMEILEGLCESSSFECNRMLEEHEDHLETWWFKRKTKHPDLHKWFCIETIKVCCPKGTFGPDCNACVGGSDRPCHGNGKCDGDGTRGGDGQCSCDHAYEGDLCLDCIDGYFNEVRNDTFSLCTECHTSCKTCTGATSQDCDECKEGWEEDDQEACVDVNECSKDESPCKEDQYCLNTEGSYSCKDIDECSQAEPVCTEENQQCVNSKGSYSCICSVGFEEEDGKCVQTQEPDKEEDSAPDTNTAPHKEL
ncbi:cysteine-rich with EGF-like domain protein 2 [Halichoeres trimaculatus]|uniref:cysteine-rich with EGF-like domain protein 2 n=1 Tax=Halichoeres trimaculatus TaxID=147232 RepID=UPI003D9F74A8